MSPTIIYCYDAYCGWCYGFSPVMKRLAGEYKDQLFFEVLSGGMIINDNPPPISSMAKYISGAYKRVEELTGVQFGQDFLWHIFNPDKSDWFLSSEKPAIAMCIFKEIYPDRQVEFAADLQYSLNYEGRDLCDDEAYRHLLHKYGIAETDFYEKLKSETYKEKAYYEFTLCKQLQVTGFPAVLLQASETKFYLLGRGFTDYDAMKQRFDSVLAELKQSS